MITDVRMPGDMDGLDLAHSVHLSFPAIPIVLISAYGEPHAGKASDFAFVQKPFRPEELTEVIRRATTQRSRTSKPE
jgi:DNA-binding NtrC family response regulator